jgi:multiple antibiotic resistance protein
MLQHAITVFLGFFAIMNPIANTPVFMGLTEDEDRITQKNIAFKSLLISFFIVFAFAVMGKAIFNLFGITLTALKLTGGVLVFIIGYEMLHGEASKMHKHKYDSDIDIAVSPLAVPILSGPGTIATAMNYSTKGGWGDIFITIIMFGILCIITYICFIFGQKLVKIIGESGMRIVTRLMGLILAVIGAQMLMEGVINILK